MHDNDLELRKEVRDVEQLEYDQHDGNDADDLDDARATGRQSLEIGFEHFEFGACEGFHARACVRRIDAQADHDALYRLPCQQLVDAFDGEAAVGGRVPDVDDVVGTGIMVGGWAVELRRRVMGDWALMYSAISSVISSI